MAYKNAYGIAGTLAAPLPASLTATVAQFDVGTAALLRSKLAAGDWTFLLVGGNATAEVLLVNYSATVNFVVVRQQDGSTLNAHVVGDPVVFSLTAAAVAAEVTPPTQTPTATGIIAVNLANPLAPAFSVVAPNFTGTGLSIQGTWPDYVFALTANDTNCCGGSSGSSTSLSIFGAGLATVVQTTSTATITVAPPTFTSSNATITITGTWPNINFTAAAGGGSGTVTSVVAGAGIVITGTPSATPVVNLLATGVTAGTYGSLVVNAFGQLVSVDPAFNPPSIIAATAPVNVVNAGHTVTISVAAAAEGTAGIVALAAAGSPLNPADHTTAVNPALLASVIAGLASPTVAGFTNYSGEATGAYSNIISGAAVTINLPSGVKALVRASVTMVNTSTPASPVQFGIAVFNNTGPTLLQGNRSITQSSQTMEIILVGPITSALTLVSTAVPAGAAVVSSALTIVTY
jgi:hypothetical protein